MVKINYSILEFDHLVEFTHDHTIFAAARENGNGHHIRLFLINETTGNVYTRNGQIDSWEQLFGSDRETILNLLAAARNNHTPVYKVNGISGSHN